MVCWVREKSWFELPFDLILAEMENGWREGMWVDKLGGCGCSSRSDSLNWLVLVDIQKGFEKYLGVKIEGFGNKTRRK